MSHFSLSEIDPSWLAMLKSRLRDYHYQEEAIASRLDIPSIYIIRHLDIPLHTHRLRKICPENILIRLFLLEEELEAKAIKHVFTPSEVEILEKIKLIRIKERGRRVKSQVKIYPYQGYYFASDRQFFPEEEVKDAELVYYIGSDSIDLASSTVRREVTSTLDLCTGTGIQAILAAKHTRKVIGVDINPRAVNFAGFNAKLNQVENVSFVVGDLYEPVGEDKFDLILANPPFVPSPHEESDEVFYRDGGKKGHDILSQIMRGLSAHLKEGGYCQIITLFARTSDRSQEELLKSWLNNGPYQTSLFLLDTYSIYQIAYSNTFTIALEKNYNTYKKEVVRWLESFVSQGIEAIDYGVINVLPGEAFTFTRWSSQSVIGDR
ncbi:MAG: HemK2/MTQ2 family protein methyltransferase [bacterium]